MKLEQDLKDLEDIAKQLESDDLALDDAIGLFERGIALATSIRTALNEAKTRIETVVESSQGTFSVEPFDLD